MSTITFLRDLLERAVKTAAESALLEVSHENFKLVGSGSSVGQVDALTLHLWTILGFTLGGAVLSILASLASLPVGDPTSASLLKPPPAPQPAVEESALVSQPVIPDSGLTVAEILARVNSQG